MSTNICLLPEEYDINEISEPLKEIITVAQEKKVDTMRQRLNDDAFQLYAELFLKNVIRKRDWRLKHIRQNLSSFVTVADESLTLLILENNMEEWIHEATEGPEYMADPPPAIIHARAQNGGEIDESSLENASARSSTSNQSNNSRRTMNSNSKGRKRRKKTRTLYTHGGINPDGTKRGWTAEGIKRYNAIMRKTKEFRLDRRYIGMEEEVRKRWRDKSKQMLTSPTRSTEEMNDEEQEEPLTEFDM
jgi:hypothetical protein